MSLAAFLLTMCAVAPVALCQDPDAAGLAPIRRVVSDPDRAIAHLRVLGFAPLASRTGHPTTGRQGTLLHRPGGPSVLVVKGRPPADAADRPLLVVVDDIRVVAERFPFSPGSHVERLIANPSGTESLRAFDPDGHVTILREKRDARPDTFVVPGPGELNPFVIEVIARYPTDGTHRYFWPKKGSWKGCTRDLEYGGVVFAKGDPQGRCYCCGLTFEVFLDAYWLWCARNARPWRIADLDVDGVRKLQVQWFGSAEDRSCIHTALVANRLGVRITEWADAEPGDFVQLWRQNGSGHSVVFLGWVRDKPDGPIVGLRYWSTQGATEGIGERVELFDERGGKRRVLREPFWLCRVGTPPPADRRR